MVNAEDVHISRTPVVISSPARSHSASYNSYHFSKNSILTVIVFAMLTMIGFTVFNLIATPEFLVKRKIEDIVTDYYENYFYDSIPDTRALTNYVDRGFARLTLHQLLLYDNHKHSAAGNSLSEYCDLDQTLIKIYPAAPFERKDYRVEYTYSCNF